MAGLVVFIAIYSPRGRCGDKQAVNQTSTKSSHPSAPSNPPQAPPTSIQSGRRLYLTHCAACHGERGDGKGLIAARLDPRPRDFTWGLFKFKSTPKDTMPADADLVFTINRGIRWSAMPPFEGRLKPDEINAIVQYLKVITESPGDPEEDEDPLNFFTEYGQGKPITVPAAPEFTTELAARGKRLFLGDKIGCHKCHGQTGKGDGPAAGDMKDTWEHPIRPRNLTVPIYKRGIDPQNLFTRLKLGIPGTTMEGFTRDITDQEIWALVAHVRSIQSWPTDPAERGGLLFQAMGCVQCHGAEGRGDGPAAVGMVPRPRDFVRADYKIRSTPHGQLPTDEDLFRVISKGLPGTHMIGWEKFLTEDERRQLVAYLKTLSPRFATEDREPLMIPTGPASVQRGREIYRRARCFMCHGETGRGDGGITTALYYEWGIPHAARDLTRGWTFKGRHEPRDIYLRITGGLGGTPMWPYRDLLSDQERWDLAHYVASLDQEPHETNDDFVVRAANTKGEIPNNHDAPGWLAARPIRVSLAGQVTFEAPSRWWTETRGTVTCRALWNGREIGYLIEWNDPSGPKHASPDSAFLQFAAHNGGKPYRIYGDADRPVRIWHWQTGNETELETAAGPGKIDPQRADFRVNSTWKEGRWHVIFRRSLEGEPSFGSGKFVPTLFSTRDGANAAIGDVRDFSTWLYTTLEPPVSEPPAGVSGAPPPLRSVRSWLLALTCVLGGMIILLLILRRFKSCRDS